MTDIYRSQHKGSQVDEAVETVLDNECKIKWGNIISGELSAQNDLWTELSQKALKTTLINNHSLNSDITLSYLDVQALPNTVKYGANLTISTDNVISLKDQDGSTLGSVPVDTYKKSEMTTIANGKASIDLDNLTSTGEAHFANLSLSNLSDAGNAKLNGKASVDLNNLSETGETHFVKTAQVDSAISNAVSTLLSTLYPVGSIYIGTQSTCPLSSLISGSTWTKIEGRYLLASGTIDGTGTGDIPAETISANGTLAAGLPQLYGEFYSNGIGNTTSGTGVFKSSSTNGGSYNGDGDGDDHWHPRAIFNAQGYNSTYGTSNTVRPAAYGVNVWRRDS